MTKSLRVFALVLCCEFAPFLRAQAPASPRIEGILLVAYFSGGKPGPIPFSSITWKSSDGGIVTTPSGQVLTFKSALVSRIIYLDAAYVEHLDADPSVRIYRASTKALEIVADPPDMENRADVAAAEAAERALRTVIAEQPGLEALLNPSIEKLTTSEHRFLEGERKVNGRWTSPIAAAPERSTPAAQPAAPGTFKLTMPDGETFAGARILRMSDKDVTIMHATGVATLPLEQLPADLSVLPEPARGQLIAAREKLLAGRRAAEEKAQRAQAERDAKTVAESMAAELAAMKLESVSFTTKTQQSFTDAHITGISDTEITLLTAAGPVTVPLGQLPDDLSGIPGDWRREIERRRRQLGWPQIATAAPMRVQLDAQFRLPDCCLILPAKADSYVVVNFAAGEVRVSDPRKDPRWIQVPFAL